MESTPDSSVTPIEPSLGGLLRTFDLTELGAELEREQAGGHRARTLARSDDLRILLVTMAAGSRIHEHRTDARISIQALRGRLRVRVADRTVELPAGRLLVVERSLPHALDALEDSAFLLSMFGEIHRGDDHARHP